MYISREFWQYMQMGVPNQCMNGDQEKSGDYQIPTKKSDADCCFLPDYSVFCQILSCWKDSN